MQISNLMTAPVISINPDTPMLEVTKILFEHGFTGMPVVDQHNTVVGIITEYDLISRDRHIHIPTFLDLMHEFKVKDNHKVKAKIKQIHQLKVKDLMTNTVVTVKPETSVKDAAQIFTQQHINPLPVVDSNNRLVGIISRADVLRLLQE